VRPDRQRVLVAPHGELDLDTVGAVATEIEELLARGFDRIVVDLRATSFMDSSGVHLLVQLARREDGRIGVIDGPQAVSRVFELSGARDVLPFER
jgi:anti-sigma B factor antagonist